MNEFLIILIFGISLSYGIGFISSFVKLRGLGYPFASVFALSIFTGFNKIIQILISGLETLASVILSIGCIAGAIDRQELMEKIVAEMISDAQG